MLMATSYTYVCTIGKYYYYYDYIIRNNSGNNKFIMIGGKSQIRSLLSLYYTIAIKFLCFLLNYVKVNCYYNCFKSGQSLKLFNYSK